MNLMPIPDMGWVVIAYFESVFILLGVTSFTILIETSVIWYFLKVSLWHSLRDAVVMNIASGLLGFTTITYLPSLIGSYDTPTPQAALGGYLRVMATFCIISITVEGYLLRLMERDSSRRAVWLISFLSNSITYLGLSVYLCLIFYNKYF